MPLHENTRLIDPIIRSDHSDNRETFDNKNLIITDPWGLAIPNRPLLTSCASEHDPLCPHTIRDNN